MAKYWLHSDGSWVTLRPVEEISEASLRVMRRTIQKVSTATRESLARNQGRTDEAGKPRTDPATGEPYDLEMVPATPEDMDALAELGDHCIMAVLTGWSFEGTPTLKGLEKLSGLDYRALSLLCSPVAKFAFQTMVDFNPTEEDVKSGGNSDSPFGSSSGSSGSSKEPSSTAPSRRKNSESGG